MMIERAEVSTSLLLVIDMQDKLLQAIDGKEVILQQTERMMKYANTLEIPIIVTEQYKKGLGESNQKIQAEASKEAVEELKLIRQGKLQGISAKQLLDEL